jgi:hypothetical protein
MGEEATPGQAEVKYFRRIIKITAWDSPNVRFGLAEEEAGKVPTNRILIPGVLSYADFLQRQATWTVIQICRGLKAEFWEGKESKLFPLDWLDRAAQLAVALRNQVSRKELIRCARVMGVDTGEGSANTVWTVGDEYGVLLQESRPTPDTSIIEDKTIDIGEAFHVPAEKWIFDQGGGGKQIVDNLRRRKYMAQSVPFGSSVTEDEREKKKLRRSMRRKIDLKEFQYAYFNRRSQMYGQASILLDPSGGSPNFAPDVAVQLAPNVSAGRFKGYAIPAEYKELRRQLGLIPRKDDGEGRLKLPPKSKKTTNSNEVTLEQILGCSPDEADSFVLMVHGLLHEIKRIVVGGVASR